MKIVCALSLICIVTSIATAEVPEWLAKDLAKIGATELKFVEEELGEGEFIYANGIGNKIRYIFLKNPLSVGHVELTYLIKNGTVAEISVKTSRTISILKDAELSDSVANILPRKRLREVCEILTQKKGGNESSCEGRIGAVFAKAVLVGDKQKRFDLYLSSSESPDLENEMGSPGKFGLGKPDILKIENETLSIPFDPSAAYFWTIEFPDTTTKKVELKIKFPGNVDAMKIVKGMRRIDDRQVALDFGSIGSKFGAEFGIDPTDNEGAYSMKLVGGGKIIGAVAYTISKVNKRKK